MGEQRTPQLAQTQENGRRYTGQIETLPEHAGRELETLRAQRAQLEVELAKDVKSSKKSFCRILFIPGITFASQHNKQLHQAALNSSSAQPVFVLGIDPSHVQDLALGLAELHEVRTGPPLKPVQVPLDGIPSLQRVVHTTQLGVIGTLAEDALIVTVRVANKGVTEFIMVRVPIKPTLEMGNQPPAVLVSSDAVNTMPHGKRQRGGCITEHSLKL
ncbi:hypothetical protein llap_4717 [Limosa lapponica baueri]|uniref:Uncharacterized protein n=1 Tax=Limosa lapponica baueri TaxID=1758121 RepID=A0A2I0UG16_LIMLA|nr:hypothetical protein llap_4717 [Limosa lapponica baueri]